MTEHAAHRSDHRPSSAIGTTSATGARLPARLRRRRALLIPPFGVAQGTGGTPR